MTPDASADRVLQHALSRRPTLGATRLVCLDGPSGSGKSTLAEAVARRVPSQLVHVDETLPGWDGFASIPIGLVKLLKPLAASRDGHWRRWDWPGDRWAEWHRVRPGGLLVVEGVGSGSRAWAPWITTLGWVEAPRRQRLARGLTRNHDMDEHWRRWQVQEDAHFARERTRERADVVLHNRDK